MQRIVEYDTIELLIELDSAPDFDGAMVGLTRQVGKIFSYAG